MATNASNNDIAASASNTHRDKRSKMDTKKAHDASNHNDAANQQLKDTLAIATRSPSQEDQIPRPFSKTPAELRIMIAKHAMEDWYYSLIVGDPSGERLGTIWRRVYWLTPTNDRHATERRTHRQVVRMGNTSNSLFNPKITFSRFPALLQVGHDLREEGREEFLKVARVGLANAEARNNFDRMWCKILLTHFRLSRRLNRLQKIQGPVTCTDAMVLESWRDMRRQAVDMVCNALRWSALRHVCELLELQP